MSEYKIYKLHFTTPLHLNTARSDLGYCSNTIHSDTFYAAVTACLAKMGKDVPSDGDLGFTMTDLFPFFQRGGDEPMYFLPKPLSMKMPDADPAMAKKIKKISWLDLNTFTSIINGKDTFKTNNEGHLCYQSSFYISSPKTFFDSDFMKSQVVQRVTIESRFGHKDAKPFYVDQLSFRYDSGMYFMVVGDTTLLDKTLPFLCEEGIGTDRNVGLGKFKYTIDKIVLDLPSESDYVMSLSLYIPESEQQLRDVLDGEMVAFNLVRRGGWITQTKIGNFRKNAIYGFISGSVFRNNDACENGLLGKIVNLRPSISEVGNPIWRSGRSIMIPIKII